MRVADVLELVLVLSWRRCLNSVCEWSRGVCVWCALFREILVFSVHGGTLTCRNLFTDAQKEGMTSGATPGAPEAGPLSSREGIARRFTIAVHAGAGSISAASESSRIAAVKAALLAARNVLFEEGGCALTACVAAVVSMEDDPLCNAGFGSSLTEDATVECDAAVMDGAVLTYGACAATPNVQNPVRLAARLLERQLGPARALGRVHPMLLAGTGAWRWAKAEGLAVFETGDDQLTSDRARQTFARYTAQVREEEAAESTCSRAEGGVAASRKRPRCAGAQDNDSISATNDTVGAVVCDGMHSHQSIKMLAPGTSLVHCRPGTNRGAGAHTHTCQPILTI